MTVALKEKILVLGCGPAGLLATHAARLEGYEVTIISKKQPSYISGAQFLHSAIPELTNEEGDGEILIVKQGSPEEYARKIYGDGNAPTSWTVYDEGEREVWSLRQWYQLLWERYEHLITEGLFNGSLLESACREYKAVFSTIPLPTVVPKGKYTMETVRICSEDLAVPNTIVYDGNPQHMWYRASNLFGFSFVEYPNGPIFSGADEIRKPLSATYRNPFDNFYPLGRYGQWQKGILVDDAFREALKICENL